MAQVAGHGGEGNEDALPAPTVGRGRHPEPRAGTLVDAAARAEAGFVDGVGDTRVNFSSLVVDEITLVGSRCGPFAPAIDLLTRGTVSVAPLVHARYALTDAVSAFAHAARPGVMKVLVEG